MKKTCPKIALLIPLLLVAHILFAQTKKTCKTKEEPIDINTIPTKCAINIGKEKNGKRKINKVNISVKRSRIRRARVKRKRVMGVDNKISTSNEVVLDASRTKIQAPEIVKNLSRKISAEEIAKSIPLSAVRYVPVFPNCLSKPQSEHLNCFNEELSRHIQKYLQYPEEAALEKIEGDVWVRFIINSSGEVSNIDVRGPKNGKLLEEEVKEVIALLPKFKPGLYNGKKVNIKYALPINFSVETDSD